ncbi:MAG: C25 family cysteine peptidase [Candidatus Thermoplasmatota archaeon]|nr:C25 family cysteine peptidase [Candidatus Thermoplasmatota archaeon]
MDRKKAILGTLAIVIVLLGSTQLAGMQLGETSSKNTCDESSIEDLTYSMNFSPPTITEGKRYASVMVKESDSYTINPGAPSMPIAVKTFTFPFETKILDIDCKILNTSVYELPQKIAPATGHVIADSASRPITMEENKEVYMSSDPYPEKWFNYGTTVGLKDGKHVIFLTVELHPVRYFPLSDTIESVNNAEIKVTFEKRQQQSTFNNARDLLIIAPDKFSDALQPLIEHKENHGVKIIFASTESIYQTSSGRDDAEKIKYFIKDAIEGLGIKYVMLVGGMKGQRLNSWYVPVRYSHLDDNSSWEASYISDLYYADIYKYEDGMPVFDDWDSNSNDIFAEWNINNKDVLDLSPDVYVGRLPCRNTFEVNLVVDRIIKYETSTYGQDWFKRMVVIGGDSFPDQEVGTDYIEGQVETDHALSFMDGFEHVRIYVKGGDIEFTPENTGSALSEGEGFVYFSGHGNPASWATHPHNDFDTWIDFGLKNIRKLDNGEKLPVLIVGGCHNSQFNVSVFRLLTEGIWAYYLGEMTPECWGWLFTRGMNGGSIATIGNTGLGYGSVGDGPVDEIPDSVPDGIPDCIQYLGGWIETHFFKVYNHCGKDILGETWGTTVTDYVNTFPIDWSMDWSESPYTSELVDCKTAQEWVLFGDPSLKIGGYA